MDAFKRAFDMVQLMERPRIGQYILTRQLEPGPLGARDLALHDIDSSSHVVHRPRVGRDRAEQRRFLAVMGAAKMLRHPHILSIEEFGLDERGHPYIVTPFTGDSTGLVTVESLMTVKGGFFSPSEARQAVVQVLEAVEAAHSAGHRHGELLMSGVLVDRRGSIAIELYGVARLLHVTVNEGDAESDEVCSVLRIGYQLVTGLVPEEPLIAAGRVVPGLDAVWDDWFETGLHGPVGFKSAAHALSAIRDRSAIGAAQQQVRGVRSVISRLLFSGR